MKIFGFILTGATLFALVFSVPMTEIQDHRVKGITDAAEAAYKALMGAMDHALETARQTINNAVGLVNDTVNTCEQSAQSLIDGAMDGLNQQLETELELAKKLGIDTSHCNKYIDELGDLPGNLMGASTKCMTDKLGQAHYYADDFLAQCQAIDQNLLQYESSIKQCANNIFTAIPCLAGLATKMASDAITIPAKMGKDVIVEVGIIKTLIPAVKLCVGLHAGNVTIEGAAIIAKFALCVGLPDSGSTTDSGSSTPSDNSTTSATTENSNSTATTEAYSTTASEKSEATSSGTSSASGDYSSSTTQATGSSLT